MYQIGILEIIYLYKLLVLDRFIRYLMCIKNNYRQIKKSIVFKKMISLKH